MKSQFNFADLQWLCSCQKWILSFFCCSMMPFLLPAQCTLVISEIMYNPGCDEDEWEWVEVYNPCPSAIAMTGWVIDDNNNTSHASANISTGMVPAGGSAILFNADDLTAADFTGAWGSCPNLIAVSSWSRLSLNNTGDELGLWDSFPNYSGDHVNHANTVDNVDYDDAGSWPSTNSSNLASIYLTNLAADNNVGSNWALSTVGGMTPLNEGYASAGASCANDVGSPCVQSCNISAISTGNFSSCINGNNDTDPGNDTFTIDVTVTFSSPPGSGSLDLSGDGTASVAVGGLSGNNHVFPNVSMPTDGGPISLTATFSGEITCTFTENNAGTAPSPCSAPVPDLVITEIFYNVPGTGEDYEYIEIYNADNMTLAAPKKGWPSASTKEIDKKYFLFS